MGATAMFGLFMRNTSFTNIRKQINLEGQQILSVIEYNLRNARVVASCTTSAVSFTDGSGNDVVISRIDPPTEAGTREYMHILVSSPTVAGTNRPLHSNFAMAGSGSIFTCAPATNANTVVINFSLEATGTGVPVQNFQSTVQIRNATIR